MTRASVLTLAFVAIGATASCTRPVATDIRAHAPAGHDEPECRTTDALVPTSWVRQVSDPDTLEVTIDAEHFNSRRFPTLRVTLSNRSLDGMLWVNRSMIVASDWVPSPLHVRIRHGMTGELLTPTCKVKADPFGDYIDLGPAGQYSQLVSLGCVIFPSCGPWLIQATYHDAVKELPKPPAHVECFSGTAISNTIEVMLDKLPYPPFTQCPNDEPAHSEAAPDAGTAAEPQQ